MTDTETPATDIDPVEVELYNLLSAFADQVQAEGGAGNPELDRITEQVLALFGRDAPASTLFDQCIGSGPRIANAVADVFPGVVEIVERSSQVVAEEIDGRTITYISQNGLVVKVESPGSWEMARCPLVLDNQAPTGAGMIEAAASSIILLVRDLLGRVPQGQLKVAIWGDATINGIRAGSVQVVFGAMVIGDRS